MRTYALIKKKRDGIELSQDEIGHMIKGFVNGDIPDYQMAAFLMAVYFRGMSTRECVDLTMAVLYSDGDENKIAPATERLLKAYTIGPTRRDPPRLFYARVSKEGVEELE